jgi:CRISPR type I-D-associated protein Csc2
MAKRRKKANSGKMQNHYEMGILSKSAKTVIVNALIETTGQVRFGDGTEVNLTITEKDLIPTSDGGFIEKVVFAGSKRRGVDRRTIHALRNQILQSHDGDNPYENCYIPNLCRECPTCWLLGATVMGKGYNIKSRILYGSAYSIESSDIAVQPHSRNMVDEKDQTTAGEAGIHTEEFIKGGIHFPTITTLERVVDWEIGVFAHALLENINQNKYTAASRAQGGVKFTEVDTIGHCIIIDESPDGIFPLPTPKIGADKTDLKSALAIYMESINLNKIKERFEAQGFEVVEKEKSSLLIKSNGSARYKISCEDDKGILEIFQCIQESCEGDEKLVQIRYYGDRALGYLREKQYVWKSFLETFDEQKWKATHEELLKKVEDKKRSSKKSDTEPSGENEPEEN